MKEATFENEIYGIVQNISEIGACDLCRQTKMLKPIKIERSILRICAECKSWRRRILKNEDKI